MIIQNAIQQQKEVFRLQTTLAFHYIPFILTITIRCEIDTSLCSCRSALHAQRALPLIIAPNSLFLVIGLDLRGMQPPIQNN